MIENKKKLQPKTNRSLYMDGQNPTKNKTFPINHLKLDGHLPGLLLF